MKSIFLIIILTFLIASCQQKQNGEISYSLANVENEVIPITRDKIGPLPIPLPPVKYQEVIKKKLIKDGRLGKR